MTNRPTMFESLEDRRLLSNSVLQWNSVALDAIRSDRTPPPLAARNLAMMHIAIADAVNGIVPSFASYLPGNGGGPRAASIDAAVASAAHDVLISVFPEQALAFENALEVALTPSVQGGKVSWNCKGYPVSAMPSTCGGR